MGYKLVFFNRNSVFANKRFINEGIIKRAFFTRLKGVKKEGAIKQRLDVSESMIEFERLLTALIKRMLNGDSVTRQEG